jgi:hypothetical protein
MLRRNDKKLGVRYFWRQIEEERYEVGGSMTFGRVGDVGA